MAITYRGFSTLQHSKKYSLTDFELARQDLLNYFSIRKGEKLMQPAFGTVIWDMLFEPLTEDTQNVITSDITRIVGYDPRLSVGQVAVQQQDNGFLVQLTLAYVPTNQTATINLAFDRNANKLNNYTTY
jgi:phage baseplate assembly protein W